MGLATSGFEPSRPDLTGSLAKSEMWTYDRGRPRTTLRSGTPAGSLYTTVSDLAQFESASSSRAAGDPPAPL